MWQAKITGVRTHLGAYDEKVFFDVEFSNTTDTRTSMKTYIIYESEITTIDLPTLKERVEQDKLKLDRLDGISSILINKIGVLF